MTLAAVAAVTLWPASEGASMSAPPRSVVSEVSVASPITETISSAGSTPPVVPSPAAQGSAGEYTGLPPQRLLDTRSGLGTTGGRVGPHTTIEVTVVGRGGIPARGVAAVVVNITGVDATKPTFVTVYPTDRTRPDISSLNLQAGATVANLVTVPVSAAGTVSLYNDSGDLDLLADVAGFYSTASGPSGSRFTALTPTRLADTRLAKPTRGPLLRGHAPLPVETRGRAGIPAAGVTAVALNVTVVSPSSYGYVTVWPAGGTQPNASNLNFATGETRANQVIVQVPASGRINAVVETASAELIIDVVGYYSGGDHGTAGRFVPFAPFRAIDTRASSPFPGDGTMWNQDVLYAGRTLAHDELAAAYVLSVTVVDPDSSGYVTVFPYPAPPPDASTVNFAAGVTVANHAIVATGPQVGLLHVGGRSHVIIDVFGAFTR